jgi:ribosomal protein S18 acetylase RimI-like enzyme
MASRSEPNLRAARPPDAAAVTGLVRAAYAPFVPVIGREPGPMGDDYGALIRAGQVWVLEEEGGIVAVLVLVDEDDGLLLDNVAVAPAAQGSGHGRRLIGFAEAEARRRGHRAIRLYTHVLMVANIALYASLGYVETHRGEEKGFHRVYMTKRL